MKVNVKSKLQELIYTVENYLNGNMSHDEISEYAWDLAENSPSKPPENEKTFWSTVFTIIHLADEEHWKDCCTKRDLGNLLNQLKEQKVQ